MKNSKDKTRTLAHWLTFLAKLFKDLDKINQSVYLSVSIYLSLGATHNFCQSKMYRTQFAKNSNVGNCHHRFVKFQRKFNSPRRSSHKTI